jgi:hypothetical protein
VTQPQLNAAEGVRQHTDLIECCYLDVIPAGSASVSCAAGSVLVA